MSDFFTKLKVGLNKGSKVIQAKGSSLIDTNKVKSELNALKKQRQQLFAEIGKQVYDAEIEGTFTTESVKEALTTIKECDVKIVEIESKLNEIKDSTEQRLKEIDEEAKLEEDAAEIKTGPVEGAPDEVEVDIEVVDKVETQVVQSTVEVELQDKNE